MFPILAYRFLVQTADLPPHRFLTLARRLNPDLPSPPSEEQGFVAMAEPILTQDGLSKVEGVTGGASTTVGEYGYCYNRGVLQVEAGESILAGSFITAGPDGKAINFPGYGWAAGEALIDANVGEILTFNFQVFTTLPMTWMQDYPSSGRTVPPGIVTNDNGYLMISNKITSDQAAPIPMGLPYRVYDGTSPSGTITAKQLTLGQRYTWPRAGELVQAWAYFVAGNNYRVYSIVDPGGTDERFVEVLSQITAQTTTWVALGIKTTWVDAGSVFDVYLAIEEPDPTPTMLSADWDYDTPTQEGAPASGQISHANEALDSVKVHKTPSAGGPVDLSTLTVGDVINGPGGIRWSIQQITDMTDYWEFIVAPAQQATPDGVFTFGFETVTSKPITTIVDTDYWDTNPNIIGRYQIDGGEWVETQDQYAIDLEIQELDISPDWDLMMKS